ncbi:hypothetical protein BCR44DRAFT_1436929 [Catenaria anguillulae PL171]|uniref:Secreted protein n=1 Tax=Catenaria anguillulae PL171 TaxID=765915 RepID=A0A1Y2HLP1_9FUNG|nr:hypothetical protein BCR44DRAFT_1436929 [Catenaria anguillulae PL171]
MKRPNRSASWPAVHRSMALLPAACICTLAVEMSPTSVGQSINRVDISFPMHWLTQMPLDSKALPAILPHSRACV